MEDAREYVDSPEITTWKIKVAEIANKKAVEFHQTNLSYCDDSDASSYVYPFDDVSLPDPELIKIAYFFKALPKCTPLTFIFAIVSQDYSKLRCQCSKVMKGWENID